MSTMRYEERIEQRAEGRRALADYLYIRPYDFENLDDFLAALDSKYYTVAALGGQQFAVTRIWHCLNMLEETDPHWENRVHNNFCKKLREGKPKAKAKHIKPKKYVWETFEDWGEFIRVLGYRGGNLKFLPPLEEREEKEKEAPPQPLPPLRAEEVVVEKQPVVANQISAQFVEEEPFEEKESAAPASKAPFTQRATAVATQTNGVGNNDRELASETAANTTAPSEASEARATAVKNEATKSTNAAGHQHVDTSADKVKPFGETSTGKPAKSKKKSLKRKSKRRGRDDGYDDCDLDEPKFVDDVNYDDVDDVDNGALDDKDVVVVNGEVRYQIPGYASRKKPRHALVSAPRFVIQNFFRQRFPGRPRCPDCRCQHPTERYMLCSDCDFCHVGGNDECYHQHPELRGTRPAKDKYRRPVSPLSTPSTGELVFGEQDKESDTGTVTGGNDTKGTVDDLTNSLGTLSFIEKDELQEDTLKLAAVFRSEMNSTSSTFEPAISVELPIRTKVDDNKQAQEDKAGAEASTPTPTPTQDVQSSLNGTSTTQSQTPLEGGGVPLSAENLSRVPHDQSHKRWASMSSLTTSSSGASLVAFQRRRKNQVQKKAAEIEKENAAAVKAAAERAALAAAARETVARATQKMVEQAAAKKALEERAAREDAEREERRIAVKKAKAARKRERQRERRREREEQERQERQGRERTAALLVE